MNLAHLEQVVRKKFGKFKKSRGKHGLEYVVRCPYCHKTDKMYLNPALGTYLCFRCGETGGLSDLLGVVDELNKEIVKPEYAPMPTNVELPGVLVTLHELASDHPAIRYIRRRGFDPIELNDTFGMRYCPSGRTFAHIYNTTNSLIFPMWMHGKLVGWQSRLLYTPDEMTDQECEQMGFAKDSDGDWIKPPKYWTSPGLPKGQIFFNYDWAAQSEIVVICEGTFDAMAVGRSGVAALGKGITEYQTRLIANTPNWKIAVLLLDPGDADKETEKLKLSVAGNVRILPVKLEGYKDAGEAPRMEIWTQIGQAAHADNVDLFNYRMII